SFEASTLIAELRGAGNVSWFDSQDTAAVTRFYWVRAINVNRQGGATSSTSASNFSATAGSAAFGLDAEVDGVQSALMGPQASIDGARNAGVGQGLEITGDDNTAVGQGV